MSVRTAIRGSLAYAIAALGGFLIAYLIVAFVIFPSGVIPRDVKIPNVTGLLFNDAAQRLAERGLKAERGEERESPAPKETVLDQSPAAGHKGTEGAVITLAVSVGQKYSTVPTVIGMTRDDAANALASAGYDVGTVSERPSAAPAGQVIGSTPKAGAQAPTPSSVALIVSAGNTVVLVPNVVGRNVSEARQILARAGLAVGDVNSSYAGSVENGKVTMQTPPAGSQVATGSKIDLIATGGE